MARARSPNRDKAYKLWIDSGKTKLLKEIAAELNVSETQIRKWKNQDKWEESKGNVTNQIKSNVTNEKKLIVKNEMEEIESSGLTDKQKLFCLYYIQENFNKTKAYMKAYECNYETARRCGSRMLTNVDIKQEIDRITEEVLEEAVINTKLLAKRIVDQYIGIAFADITDYVKFGRKDIEVGKTEEGEPIIVEVNYIDFRESDEVDGSLISEIKQGKDGISVKLHDKMKAMQWLADRMDLLPQSMREKLEIEKAKLKMIQEKHDKEMGSNNKEPIKIEFMKASERLEENE
ncbi:terminase small subunit [Zhenhengia yiwuensis]|uniref:Terminase small subunit n=1 Tax=Zhenhengia yiwuensis TaxID=2763666 RepID=A0A926EKQ3_9FIRM|nr:terminase small subunit [Zhenhengia yiwuensis]MBC8581384.1 terminase small subunit [Zhenhengia yiwuensis]